MKGILILLPRTLLFVDLSPIGRVCIVYPPTIPNEIWLIHSVLELEYVPGYQVQDGHQSHTHSRLKIRYSVMEKQINVHGDHQCSLTKTAAIPIPEPMHILVTNTLSLLCLAMFKPVAICRAPAAVMAE